MCLVRGERADYLSEFTRAVGGEVILDKRDHTAKIRLFGGSKALRTRACTALLDTGSPASFIKENVWQEILACGSDSGDGRTEITPKTWVGFHGVPLTTSSYVRLNIQLENINKTDQGSVRSPTVCLVVFAHVVPEEAMTVDVLFGRDSWAHFPLRKCRDMSEKTTIVTFVTNTNGLESKEERYRKWINNAVGMVEREGKGRVIVCVASHNHKLPNAMSWLLVSLTNADGTEAEKGAYYIRFGPEWFPQEAIVDSGISEIPIRRIKDEFLVKKGMRLGVGGDRLVQCDLDNSAIIPNDIPGVNKVVGSGGGNSERSADEPPATVLSGLSTAQKQAFLRLWSIIPIRFRAVHSLILRRPFGQLRTLTRWVLYYASMHIDFPSIALIWDMSLSTLSASF